MLLRTIYRGISLLCIGVGLYFIVVDYRIGGLASIGIGVIIGAQWLAGIIRDQRDWKAAVLIGIILIILGFAFEAIRVEHSFRQHLAQRGHGRTVQTFKPKVQPMQAH